MNTIKLFEKCISSYGFDGVYDCWVNNTKDREDISNEIIKNNHFIINDQKYGIKINFLKWI